MHRNNKLNKLVNMKEDIPIMTVSISVNSTNEVFVFSFSCLFSTIANKHHVGHFLCSFNILLVNALLDIDQE